MDVELKKGTVFGVPKKKEESIELLTNCYAENLIELEEFENRVTLIEKAKTIEEIDELMSDVPNHIISKISTENSPQFQKKEIQNGSHNFLGLMSEQQIVGDWLQNSSINANTIMGRTFIDFTETTITTETTIQTVTIMGELHIVVPEDIAIKSSVIPIMGEARNPDNSKVNHNKPALIIKGAVLMGSLRIQRVSKKDNIKK